MSLDFPNRNKWLAIRRSSPMQMWTLVWNSGDGTFAAGRNAEKRAMGRGRQRVKTRKAVQRIERAAAQADGRQVKPHRSGGQRSVAL